MENEIEHLRTEHESGTEWNLRKHFLSAHWGKFSENRLKCLSNCFVNVEMYGCTYPEQLMIELKDLIEDIEEVVDDHRNTMKEHTQIKFVKAKETEDVGSSRQKKIQGMTFVKASDGPYSSVETRENQSLQKQVANIQMTDTKVRAGTEEEVVSRFYMLGACIRTGGHRFNDPIRHLHTSAKYTQMTVGVVFKVHKSRQHLCEVSVDGVFISSAEDSSKSKAEWAAFQNALQSLKKPYMEILTLSPGMRELHTSDTPIVDSSKNAATPSHSFMPSTSSLARTRSNIGSASAFGGRHVHQRRGKNKAHFNRTLEQFIILEPLRANYVINAVSILHESGAFNKMPVTFDFQVVKEGTECRLFIGGNMVASEVGSGKSIKCQVAVTALSALRVSNWTLFVKQQVDGDEAGITKDEVSTGASANQAIPESNIGNKLLKLMGWAGGGVGKDGKGIAEPVSLEATINRQGLGLGPDAGFTKNFFPKIKKLLEEYITSNNTNDLSFAPDFTKEERAVIHKHCQKLGLKTRSYNQQAERYLVVSRKRDSLELIRHVAAEGGATSKYRLSPPGEYEAVRQEVLAELGADTHAEMEEG